MGMNDHLETGFLGEQLACNHLTSLGYSILERNFRVPFGEIDIVARDTDTTLVIVEVKTLRTSDLITPEDNLTRSKFHKLSRIASFYANQNPSLVPPDSGFRIDLITVTLDPLPSNHSIQKTGKNNFAVSHYKNISL